MKVMNLKLSVVISFLFFHIFVNGQQFAIHFEDALKKTAKDSVMSIILDSNDVASTIDLRIFPNIEELYFINWGGDYSLLAQVNILKSLIIYHSSDVSSIDFSVYKNLEKLEISNMRLTAFPKGVTDLKKLKVLNVGEHNISLDFYCNGPVYFKTQNKITEIPESISNLTALEELDISYNPISAFPSSFAKLTKLNYLHIDGTSLTELPACITNPKNGTKFILVYLKGKYNNFTRETKGYLRKQDMRASSVVKCVDRTRIQRMCVQLK
jgi:Leucine-rich repeat (LRR) protein